MNLQAPGRIFREIGREGREDAIGIFDQIEADLVGLDVSIIFQRAADELAHLRYRLHSREAGANHDESQELLFHVRIVGDIGGFQAADHMRAEPVRVGEVLHGERMLRQAGEPLQIDAGAKRDDDLVIMKVDRDQARPLHDDHLLLLEVDTHNLGLAHLEPPQQLAQGHDRVGRMDARGGDLRQQWLEDEIVIGVNELDIELAAALPLERLGREHTAEAAADHEDFLFLHGSPAFLQAANTYANAALRQVTRMKQEETISPY